MMRRADLLTLTDDDPEKRQMPGTARPYIGHRDRVGLTLVLTRSAQRHLIRDEKPSRLQHKLDGPYCFLRFVSAST